MLPLAFFSCSVEQKLSAFFHDYLTLMPLYIKQKRTFTIEDKVDTSNFFVKDIYYDFVNFHEASFSSKWWLQAIKETTVFSLECYRTRFQRNSRCT